MEESVIQINGGITVNVNVRVKNVMYAKKITCTPSTCSCENGKYLASIMDESAITCGEVIESYDEETKTASTNFNENKGTCKAQNFYILLAFLLITMALLIGIRIYYYLIKRIAKQKHLLSFHDTNNELKQVLC